MSPLDESSGKANLHVLPCKPGNLRSRTPAPEKAEKIIPSPATEQFPVLPPENTERFPRRRGTRARSLTQAEIAAITMKPAEVDSIADSLKSADSPMSLEQSRKRRATMKEVRKDCVNFLKKRTAERRASQASQAAGISIPKIEVSEPEVGGRGRARAATATVNSGGLYNFGEMEASLDSVEENAGKE